MSDFDPVSRQRTTISRPKLLAVDDDEEILAEIDRALSEDYRVFKAIDRASALAVFKGEEIPIVLLDLGLPPRPNEGTEGLLLLEELLSENHLAKVIVISGNSERSQASLALKRGAHDIFPKPVDVGELKVVLRRVQKRWEIERESHEEGSFGSRLSFEHIIGSSPPMEALFATVRKVSSTDVSVLITGESGTGKELFARAIHNLSPRHEGPFIPINCGAIPENLLESELFGHEKGAFTGATAQRRGKLEYAKGGSLFLDEIGDLAPNLQVKLLRFLQEKVIERVGGREFIAVDSRVIAATHQDIETAVREAKFREDLYFRLAVVKLSLPPLRTRGDDVIVLAEHLAASYSKELKRPARKFTKQSLEALRRHPWPGNVRELENRVKRAVVLAEGPLIGVTELDLSAAPSRPSTEIAFSLKEAKEGVERELVVKALHAYKGNISKAARALGISRPTFYDLMGKYGLA